MPSTAGSYRVVVTFPPNDTPSITTAPRARDVDNQPRPSDGHGQQRHPRLRCRQPGPQRHHHRLRQRRDSAVVSGSASLSTPATPTSPVGTYTITAAQGTLSAANYKFTTFPVGTLTVVPAVQSLAASPVAFQNLDTGSVPLATFNDAAGTANTYAATINWNDGSACPTARSPRPPPTASSRSPCPATTATPAAGPCTRP